MLSLSCVSTLKRGVRKEVCVLPSLDRKWGVLCTQVEQRRTVAFPAPSTGVTQTPKKRKVAVDSASVWRRAGKGGNGVLCGKRCRGRVAFAICLVLVFVRFARDTRYHVIPFLSMLQYTSLIPTLLGWASLPESFVSNRFYYQFYGIPFLFISCTSTSPPLPKAAKTIPPVATLAPRLLWVYWNPTWINYM